jgi:hypothetical protein
MCKRLLYLVTALLAGCGEQQIPQAPKMQLSKEKDIQVERRIGGPEDSEPPLLPFKITAIHENRKLLTEPPAR